MLGYLVGVITGLSMGFLIYLTTSEDGNLPPENARLLCWIIIMILAFIGASIDFTLSQGAAK